MMTESLLPIVSVAKKDFMSGSIKEEQTLSMERYSGEILYNLAITYITKNMGE